ncbi:hypothetical protein Tco_1530389 [Tanacetum coccineum]
METQKPLLKDEDGEEVDVHMYRSMIGSLGLWYPKYSHFDLVTYTDSDYARASLDRKSTTGDQEKVGEGSEMPTDPQHTPIIIQPSTSQPQKKQRSTRSKRKDIEVPQPSGPITNIADKAVNEEMDDSLERASTTATSLEA